MSELLGPLILFALTMALTPGPNNIMVTASAAEDSKQVAYGVNPKLAGYIVKPFKPDQLLAVVRPYVQFNA